MANFDIYSSVLGNGNPGSPNGNDALDTIMVGANPIAGGSDGPGGYSFAVGPDGTPIAYLPKWAYDMGLHDTGQSLLQGYTNTYTLGNDIYAGNAVGHVNPASGDGSQDFTYIDPSSWIKFDATSPQFAIAHAGKQAALNGVNYSRLDGSGNVVGNGTFSGLYNKDHLDDYMGLLAAAVLTGGAAAGAAGAAGAGAAAGAGGGAAAGGAGGITGAGMASGAGLGAGAAGSAFGGIGAGAAGSGFGLGTLGELGIGGASTFGSAGLAGLGAGAAGAGLAAGGGLAAGSGLGGGAPGSAFGGIGSGSVGGGYGFGTLPELGVGGGSTFGSAGVGGMEGAGAALGAAGSPLGTGTGGVGPSTSGGTQGVPPPANPNVTNGLGGLSSLVGGLLGGQGNNASTSANRQLPDFLQNAVANNLIPQTTAIMNAQLPQALQYGNDIARKGGGLLDAPVAGNGYTAGVGTNVAGNGYDMLTSRPVTGNGYGQVQMEDPSKFMSPFYGSMADDLQRRTADLLAQNNNSIRGSMVGAGGLGGSRQGVAEGTAAGKAADTLQGNLATMGGNLYQSALSGALQKYGTDTNFYANQRQQDLSKYFGDADIYNTNRSADIANAGQQMSFYNSQRGQDLTQAGMGADMLTQGLNTQFTPLKNASGVFSPFTGFGTETGSNSSGGGAAGVAGGLLSGAAFGHQMGWW